MTLVLLVGGTGEARALAADLDGTPGLHLVSSLAGAVARPRLPVGEVRVGGFGGAQGLARWLREHDASAVVDASHPFASRISASCVAAAAATGVPLLRLERPAWSAEPGDSWYPVPDVPAAAAVLPTLLTAVDHAADPAAELAPHHAADPAADRAPTPAARGRRVLVTTGRRDLPAFYAVPGVELLLARCVDPPVELPPPHVEVLLDRGPYTVEGERELLRSRRIDVLVTKNSGGSLTAAKLVAARSLGLPVVVVQRPVAPPGARPPAVVHDVPAAAAWVRARLTG